MESPLLHVVNSCCHNSQNNSPQSHPGSALKVNLSRRIIAQVTEERKTALFYRVVCLGLLTAYII